MALKKTLTKDEHAKLSDALKSEYKADGEGFILDVEGGFEDVAGLKRAKDFEKAEAARLKRELKDATDTVNALTEERDGLLKGAIPKADVERLEGSYKSKMAAKEAELTGQITAATTQLEKILVDNEALALASKLSTSPDVLLPHIKSRIRAEKGADGNYTTKIVDADGKPTALTTADLEKEIVANKAFAPILTGSKASGGGSHGGGGGGGAPGAKVDWSKPMTVKEQVASMKAAGLAPQVPA